jgi:exopolysaccharide biosynthesis WecB/TagA/CpsF family protein
MEMMAANGPHTRESRAELHMNIHSENIHGDSGSAWSRLPATGPGGSDAAQLLSLVNTASAAQLLSDLERRLDRNEGFAVATLNLDHLVKLRRSAAFRAAYAAQTHVVADGNPVVWLRSLAGQPVTLAPGSELVAPLMALAARRDVPVAFVGSTDAALAAAAERLERAHPGLRVVARIAPPFGFDPQGCEAAAALDALAASGARLVLMALGAPKQEMLAARALARMPQMGFVSVGAGIDFVAGTQRRAPVWMRTLRLEWLWRMLSDPRRLTMRYLLCFAILPGMTLGALRMRRG